MPVYGRAVISAPRNGIVRALAVVVFGILCGAVVATAAAFVSAQVMEGRTTGIGDLAPVLVMVFAEPLRLNAESDVLLVTYALCIAVFAAVGFQSRE